MADQPQLPEEAVLTWCSACRCSLTPGYERGGKCLATDEPWGDHIPQVISVAELRAQAEQRLVSVILQEAAKQCDVGYSASIERLISAALDSEGEGK